MNIHSSLKLKLNLKLNIGSIIALIYALTPFLQLYVVPGVGTNLAFSLIFFLGGIYAIYSLFKSSKNKAKTLVKPIMVCMFIYCNLNLLLFQKQHIYNSKFTSFEAIFFYFLILVICVIVFQREKARHSYFNYVVQISILMSIIVVLQSLIYYTTGSTITADKTFFLPFREFFTKSVIQYLQTHPWVSGNLYRPSAFFLEPAHFGQYCSIGLTYSLWKSKTLFNWQSVFISIGVLITTSGLGLFCLVIMWGVKLFLNGDSLTKKKITKIISVTLLFSAVLVGLFVFSDSFQRSVLRIIIASDGQVSAATGRLWSVVFIENLSGKDLFFGMGYKNIPTYGVDEIQYYMTGIVELIYCQGILGGCIFIISYFYMMLETYKRKEYLPLYILILYLPILVGSASLGMLTLIEYIPFLYISKIKNYELAV